MSRSASDLPDIQSARVTAITIFLDPGPFLAEAIDSALRQSYSNLELLLVDDGSTDGSSQLARTYEGNHPGRVRYLEHEGHANRGMSATRNLGLKHATGEFVAFLDADDVWEPKKIEEQVALFNRFPQLGMVCGVVNYWRSWANGIDRLVPTGHVRNRVVMPPEASLALYPLGTAAAPCPSDILLRRDAALRIGGFEEHFTGPRQMYEDQGFLAKLYLSTPVYFSDRVWLRYRQHEASCVAAVVRDGHYAEVREYFLRWFRDYLATSSSRPELELVKEACERALWPYDHPRMARARDQLATIGRRVRKELGRLRRVLAGS